MNYQEKLLMIKNGLMEKECKPKPKKWLNKVSPKKAAEQAQQKEIGSDSALDKWFEARMAECEPVCAECGMRADWLLQEYDDKKKMAAYRLIWRACQAHILPKKKVHGFPSIATHPNNHIVLFPSWGGHLCGCHGFYDSGWYNASSMKIWGIVLPIIKERLLPLIADTERKNIPDEILKYIQKHKPF